MATWPCWATRRVHPSHFHSSLLFLLRKSALLASPKFCLLFLALSTHTQYMLTCRKERLPAMFKKKQTTLSSHLLDDHSQGQILNFSRAFPTFSRSIQRREVWVITSFFSYNQSYLRKDNQTN
mgnify:FL=1